MKISFSGIFSLGNGYLERPFSRVRCSFFKRIFAVIPLATLRFELVLVPTWTPDCKEIMDDAANSGDTKKGLMRTVQTIRKNSKSLNFKSVRSAMALVLAFLATACGASNSNKNLRNYAGQMKTLEYYKDFTDYENPKQSQPSAEAEADNHDYFPEETHEHDPVTPTDITTPAATTPAAVTPATPDVPPAPVTEQAPAPIPAPTTGTVETVPPVIQPSKSASVGTTPQDPTRPNVEVTPPSPATPTTPPRKSRPAVGQPAQEETPKSGDCRLSDKPCFPIAGKTHFTDDFGARRSGGRRHAGNDLFAEKLTPVVAIEDGVIDRADRSASDGSGHNAGRLSGNYIGINHGNGVRTLYIHLNNDSPGSNDGQGHGLMPNIQVGVHVKKGQIIGWVGNSGNAETTPSHLHFEMRVTNDKVAAKAGHKVQYFPVNPYSMLKEVEGNKIKLPMAYEY